MDADVKAQVLREAVDFHRPHDLIPLPLHPKVLKVLGLRHGDVRQGALIIEAGAKHG